MNQEYSSKIRSIGYGIGAVSLACLLGVGSGMLMVRFAPQNKLSWSALALAPLWLLLEFFFEGVVALLGSYAKIARVASTVAVVAGFYIVWFVFRG